MSCYCCNNPCNHKHKHSCMDEIFLQLKETNERLTEEIEILNNKIQSLSPKTITCSVTFSNPWNHNNTLSYNLAETIGVADKDKYYGQEVSSANYIHSTSIGGLNDKLYNEIYNSTSCYITLQYEDDNSVTKNWNFFKITCYKNEIIDFAAPVSAGYVNGNMTHFSLFKNNGNLTLAYYVACKGWLEKDNYLAGNTIELFITYI